MSFAAQLAAHLPDALTLPAPIAEVLDDLEAAGHGGAFLRRDPAEFTTRFIGLYPPELRDAPGASHVIFAYEAGPPIHAPPPEATARMASIARIAGDGGTLALWLDPDGAQHFVVFDHGTPFVLTADPLVALQFLALGYPEPAAIGDAALTPAEVAARDMAEPPMLPEAYRAILTNRFGCALPARASDLGITIPAPGAPDACNDWLTALLPPLSPESAPLTEAGFSPEHPFVITPGMRAALGDDGVASLRQAMPYVIEAPAEPGSS